MSTKKKSDFLGTGGQDLEPQSSRRPMPAIMLAILAVILFWGDRYVMDNGADLMGKEGSFPSQVYYPVASARQLKPLVPDPREMGELVYKQSCMPCHQPNGLGQPGVFPPLAASEWVLEPGDDRLIRIVLDGLAGPITVSGQKYNSAMVPWRDSLDDEQIAAVLTYIRSEWGNDAAEVSADDVTAIRGETASRAGRPYSETELMATNP